MFKIIENVKSLTKTLFYFSVACSLIPFLMVSFVCVNISNKLWIYCLSKKYPIYEFSNSKKIRSLIDTTRNAAIFHFLLDINGICDYEKIKDYYINYLIDKRNKIGELRYPKLRKKLISCWGQYAWVKDDSDFNVDNHIVLNTKQYRGRPVTENNLQEFVSDLITKYLPPEIPPWQVIIIPILTSSSTTTSIPETESETVTEIESDTDVKPIASTSTETELIPKSQLENEHNHQDEKYYILIRIHHLLLADENNLHISELLMLNTDKSNPLSITSGIHDASSNDDHIIDNSNPDELTSKFSDFIQKPKHIPNLWNHIMITASNRWNEFIYHFDPLESPDVDKRQQIKCLSQLISILFITFVTIIHDFIKGYRKTNNQIKYKLKYFINLCKRELYKRNITIQTIIDSILTSMNPLNIFKNFIKYFWWLTITLVFLWPYYVYCELNALKELILNGHTNLSSNTFIGFLSVYFPLIMNAIIELYEIIIEIVKTPRNIYEELFINRSKEGNILQIKSYCGRKVISFSKSIDMTMVRKKLNKLNENQNENQMKIDENEYLLSCLSTSLYKYLEEFRDHRIPKQLNVTLRSINKKYFLEKYNKTAHIGGVLFLQLPLSNIVNRKQIYFIENVIKRLHNKQKIIYLLSLGQLKYELLTSILPQVWMKIFINYFSINFPVTITEIYGNNIMNNIEVNWGQKLNDLLFFRPPQSKTCLSLNLHRFGNKSRLTVMADTQLAPEHIKISTNWENYVENTNLSI